MRLKHASLLLGAFFCVLGAHASSVLTLSNGGLIMRLDPANGAYSFSQSSHQILAADSAAGILLNGSAVHFGSDQACSSSHCELQGGNAAGETMSLSIRVAPHRVDLIATPKKEGSEVRFQTAGAAPGYGLADHAVYRAKFENASRESFDTDITGFKDDEFLSGQGIARLVSNFAIYPRQHFAALLIDPNLKIVHSSAEQIVQGVAQSHGRVHMLYFFGNPHEIYLEYLRARREAGYQVLMPKWQAFGVGWEAFGALGWDTNTDTVRNNVDRYLQLGYPLKWIVIGSGFWPAEPDTMHETTSFGLWDKAKYPNPASLIQHFKEENLGVMLGLRITFIVGGPYSQQGVDHGYFLKDYSGQPRIFRGGWPKLPYYLLDAHNKAALDWYIGLVGKWQAFGIDGWKEDFYGYGAYKDLRDDKVDPTNDRLMAQNQLVIERNGYLSSNGDLHRINDFNYNQNQDRGPVNALAFAYSGFPFVYPDIVGGTFGESHFQTTRTPRMERYMMRNAQWASLHSSMGMGEPPWTFSAETARVMLAAAKLHAHIAPYIYSNARRTTSDGYPWTMTPLPIAFPNDAAAFGRENAKDHAYEWMIGDAMLATPLYGDDYETASSRNVYLPLGTWMDYDTGKIYTGHQTLQDFALPPGKTPLFIGGSGITLEEIEGTDRVCVYPVTASAEEAVTLPSSEKPITVRVHGPKNAGSWNSIHVTDQAGSPVPSRAEGHGFSFVPVAGNTYTVQAKQ